MAAPAGRQQGDARATAGTGGSARSPCRGSVPRKAVCCAGSAFASSRVWRGGGGVGGSRSRSPGARRWPPRGSPVPRALRRGARQGGAALRCRGSRQEWGVAGASGEAAAAQRSAAQRSSARRPGRSITALSAPTALLWLARSSYRITCIKT